MLSLEKYAGLRFAIERRGARDPVLHDARVSVREWLGAQRHWLGAIASEIARGQDGLASRYLDAYGAASSRPELTTAAHLATPPPARPLLVPSYLAAVQPSPPRVVEPAAPQAVTAPAPRGKSTAPLLTVQEAPSLPFNPAPPPPAPALRAERHPSEVVRPAVLDAPPNVSSAHPGTGTAWAPNAPSGPALPFETLGEEAMGFTVARFVELSMALRNAGEDRARVLEGFGLDASRHAKLVAYFEGKFASSASMALEFGRVTAAAEQAARQAARPPARRVDSGTVLAPAGLPGVAQQGAPVPALSVEQYAWLSATLRKATAQDLPDTLVRLRLTPESRATLEAQWRARMAADPALKGEYIAALARYLGGAST